MIISSPARRGPADKLDSALCRAGPGSDLLWVAAEAGSHLRSRPELGLALGRTAPRGRGMGVLEEEAEHLP